MHKIIRVRVHTYVHKHTYKRTFHVVITAYPGVRWVPPSENRIKSESLPRRSSLDRDEGRWNIWTRIQSEGPNSLNVRSIFLSLSRTTSFTATHHHRVSQDVAVARKIDLSFADRRSHQCRVSLMSSSAVIWFHLDRSWNRTYRTPPRPRTRATSSCEWDFFYICEESIIPCVFADPVRSPSSLRDRSEYRSATNHLRSILVDPFRSPNRMPRCCDRLLLRRTFVFGRSKFKRSGLGLVDRGSSLAAALYTEIQRVPCGRLSCANPKTPGGVHVTGPPSRVPLWLAPIVLVTVWVPRSAQKNLASDYDSLF